MQSRGRNQLETQILHSVNLSTLDNRYYVNLPANRHVSGVPRTSISGSAQGSVRAAQSAPSRNRLTPAPANSHHQAVLRPRPRSPLPADQHDRRPRFRGTAPNATTTRNNTTITTTDRRARAPRVPLTPLLNVPG